MQIRGASVLRLIGCGLLVLAATPAARAAGFDVTAQDRSVSLDIVVNTLSCFPPPSGCTIIGTTNHSDSESAPDFSPFSATAGVSPFGSNASQTSSLSASSLIAQGSGTQQGSGGFSAPPNIFTTSSASSRSHFEASFDVDEPTPYRLTGSVTATGGLTANAITRIELRTSGGQTIAEVEAETDFNCQEQSCSIVGPFPLFHQGVLAPGSYVLEAETDGDATPFFFAGNFLSLTSTGQYDVRLDVFAVPALGGGGNAVLAAALALGGAWLAASRRPRAS